MELTCSNREYVGVGNSPLTEIHSAKSPSKKTIAGGLYKELLAKGLLTRVKNKSEYTHEERSRGGLNAAKNKRTRVHDAIDSELKEYIVTNQSSTRFVMAHFLDTICPWLTNQRKAVARYGEYIKLKLKKYNQFEFVIKLEALINNMRRSISKRLHRTFAPLWDGVDCYFTRFSSNVFESRFMRLYGAFWDSKCGAWLAKVCIITGEIITPKVELDEQF